MSLWPRNWKAKSWALSPVSTALGSEQELSHTRVCLQSCFLILSWLLLSSCGLYSKAGSAGLSGADPAAQAACGHLEGRARGSFSAQTLHRHLLWGERRRQVHQPRQGNKEILPCRNVMCGRIGFC